MFWFILGILVFIIGIIIGIVGFVNGEKGIGAASLSIGAVLGIILIILSLFGTVPTGHTGVVTTFGRVEDHTLEAGIVTKAPWQRVVTNFNFVKNTDFLQPLAKN